MPFLTYVHISFRQFCYLSLGVYLLHLLSNPELQILKIEIFSNFTREKLTSFSYEPIRIVLKMFIPPRIKCLCRRLCCFCKKQYNATSKVSDDFLACFVFLCVVSTLLSFTVRLFSVLST